MHSLSTIGACLLLSVAAGACTRSIPPRPVPPPALTLAALRTDVHGWDLPEGATLERWNRAWPTEPDAFAVDRQTGVPRRTDGRMPQLNADGTLEWQMAPARPLSVRSIAQTPDHAFVYLATKPDERAPRGRIIEAVPPLRHGRADPLAQRWDASLFLQAGNPREPSHHAYYLAAGDPAEWLDGAHVMAAVPGWLWVTARDTASPSARDALFVIPTQGGWRGRPYRVLRMPEGGRLIGVSPVGESLLLRYFHDDRQTVTQFRLSQWKQHSPLETP